MVFCPVFTFLTREVKSRVGEFMVASLLPMRLGTPSTYSSSKSPGSGDLEARYSSHPLFSRPSPLIFPLRLLYYFDSNDLNRQGQRTSPVASTEVSPLMLCLDDIHHKSKKTLIWETFTLKMKSSDFGVLP